MSFSVKKILQFPQDGLDYGAQYDTNTAPPDDLKLLGGILQDAQYIWQAKGPVLEIRNTKSGSKVGAWVFGGILKDSNTKIVSVEEVQRPNGRISLLVVGIECAISSGIICIFDVFSSKVIRAIQMKQKISSLHVIDSGIEDLNLPGPLRNFDGILAVGTDGGEVILIDLCRQMCEESLHFPSKRDELNPSQIVLLTIKHISKIEQYKERCVRDGNHLGIHLNVVLDNITEHFVLKGPKGENRIIVNKAEATTSAIYYCSQLASLLVGYNFGAFQLWDLTSLKLVYTSPVCEEHVPITTFALQEPTDDPRAFCYVWVSYSNTEAYQMGLPFAVMYALCYESKEYHEGYGFLYQDFNYCNIRYQMELGHIGETRSGTLPKGGHCLGLQSLTKLSTSKESFSHSVTGDTLSLCMISWNVWFSKSDVQSCFLVFDLNQWYKEQMPTFTKWQDCKNYILKANLNDLIIYNGHKQAPTLNVLLDQKSLTQFIGVQKLEEHFFPTSLSFNLWILRETDTILMFSQGSQKSLLTQIEKAGPLCLIRPTEICRQAINVGLAPLFVDILPIRAESIDSQREIIFNIALEHQLIGWLCKCAFEWANGSFSSAGCSLDSIITWAFQRAVILKSNCDKFCTPLFDYSQSRLDANNSILLNSCTKQIGSLYIFYKYIMDNLVSYVSCLDLMKEHSTGLEMISVYFEVIQWLVNVGLLPECHPSTYPRPDNSERISAPYPVQELMEYYDEKRAVLSLLSKETFESSGDSLLFIDNLINRKCGGPRLQIQWQEDGGSGLYPPPSLQSLVRTYLVDGTGISNKHSLVIYLFLDLAMALDQNRYSSVVTHLIKFPAVFKVSPSVIKITQAFWQLDHGDFATAMEQLLDPFVLGEDLQPWHHTIAMRSLLIHKQPNFALLYMQVRKPPISDEKDVLTAISLFISNNMLDEAFYFKKQHQNNNGEKLLTHLFRECSKNDALHLVLYKCLTTEEEKTFFKYLKSVQNPTSEDLQIFYYLLRSRFIEAFDTHSVIRRKFPDRQGLVGQSLASKTDHIVQVFKTLLPDVNKKFVDYIRKERNNLWKEVQRPTPMSVFVHNTKEQVQYKSTLIHAALAKAKKTFQNTSNKSYNNELITEETPFLRTPTISRNGHRVITPVITSKIIDTNVTDEEVTPSPCKRMKLGSRERTKSSQSPLKNNAEQITLTPLVKRKISLDSSSHSISNFNLCTPQSILKVRHLVQQNDSTKDDSITDEDSISQLRAESLVQKTNLRLQPRASISNSPKRQHVQFDETICFSPSLSDESSRQLERLPIEDLTKHRSSVSSKDLSDLLSSTSEKEEGSDEVFYSPDNSASIQVDEENKIEHVEKETIDVIKEVQIPARVEITPPKQSKITAVKETEIESVTRSPRGRRSYKRSLSEMSPTRSSPRLSKLYSKSSEDDFNTVDFETFDKPSPSIDSISTDSLSPKPKILPKIKGRKSLSRQVLEHNTFSKMHKQIKDDIVFKEVSHKKSESITITEKSQEYSKSTNVESKIETIDTSLTERNSLNTHSSHSFSSSINKKQFLEQTFDTDTTGDSFQIDEQNESTLSESLQNYMDSLMANDNQEQLPKEKFSNEEQVTEVQIHQSLQEDGNTENEYTEILTEEKQKLQLLTNEEFLEGEATQDQQHFEENQAEECFIVDDVEIIKDQQNPQIEDSIKESQELPHFATFKTLQDEEYTEPLTVAPNEAELPTSEIYDDIYDINEDYRELSKEELEEDNIFGLVEESNSSISNQSESDNFDLPYTEKGLDEHRVENTHIIETKTENVFVISSSEEESSFHQTSSSPTVEDISDLNLLNKSSRNSGYSNTTEENSDCSDKSHSNVEIHDKLYESIYPELQLSPEKQESKNFILEETEQAIEFNRIQVNFEVPRNEKVTMVEQKTVEKPTSTVLEENQTLDNTKLGLIKEGETSPVTDIKKTIDNDEDLGQNTTITKEKLEDTTLKSSKYDLPIVDSSTNTTIVIEDYRAKVEYPTSVVLKEEATVKIIDEELEIENKTNKSSQHDLPQVDSTTNETRPKHKLSVREKGTTFEAPNEDDGLKEKRREYSWKKGTDHQTTSSSDTTNGESFIKEVAAVQFHTIDITSNKKDPVPARRTTRKTHSEIVDIDLENVDSFNKRKDLVISIIKDDDMIRSSKHSNETTKILNPERETGRSFSVSEVPVTNSEKLIPSHQIDCEPNSSFALIADNSSKNLLKEDKIFDIGRRTRRSLSVSDVPLATCSQKLIFSPQIDCQPNSSFALIADNSSEKPNKEDKTLNQGRRTRRALSVSDVTVPVRSQKLTRRQQIDCEPNDSFELVADNANVAVKLARRKKRSATVDEVRTFSRQSAPKRKVLTNDDIIFERKAQSVTKMPVTLSKVEDKTKTNRKAKSAIATYTATRRLTRTQANLVKDITTVMEESQEDIRPNISLEDLDPINLLDKPSFEGNPDPEEIKVYEPSSPSSTTSVQRGTRKKRSNSVLSEVSTPPSPSQSSPSRKGGRSTRSQTKSPVALGVSTRSRKQSETCSVLSDQAESLPLKRTRKRIDLGVESSGRTTRSRSGSVSSVISDTANSPKKVVRAKRIIVTKSDLSEIAEEKTSKDDDEVSTSKKRQTRRKT